LAWCPSLGVFPAAAAIHNHGHPAVPPARVLSLYHPTRLAEEIAMLDQLSRGAA
jgi:alkanesulfonate monooxygenase SsuD/methylene tetrahydromethanopterin reductase-like flavin-dependent oxidoreductase (luciferase family)